MKHECIWRRFIGQTVDVVIDRSIGSKHPKYGFHYELNYGYVPNTISGDGEELDAYIIGIYKPMEKFHGEVIAIIHRLNDDDDKLIVVPQGSMYSDEEISLLTSFQERYFHAVIIR